MVHSWAKSNASCIPVFSLKLECREDNNVKLKETAEKKKELEKLD